MAKADLIPAFPVDVDRNAFGNWLSGFADGEAYFSLRLLKPSKKRFEQPTAFVRIAIRDDDLPILESIQSYWQCGNIMFAHNRRSKIPNARPVAIYQVTGRIDLCNYVLPHFEAFPLRSKKRRDFVVWREGVELMATVQQQPDTYRRVANIGRPTKWSHEQREHFRSLTLKIRDERQYVARLSTLLPST